MYGMPPPKPSFFRAWSVSVIVSAPLAWFVWHSFGWPLWVVLALWFGLTLLSAQAVLGRMANDWRAKGTMRVLRDRFRH